jgi:GST-like protein
MGYSLAHGSGEEMMAATHHLLGCKGCGSAVVEAAFALAGVPLDREEVDYSRESPTRERLLAVNPLGQVPALILPDGRVLTESLAIVHYVNDLEPGADLVPSPGDATRTAFYRWAVFIVAAVYPTFTYGDDPGKWVGGEECGKRLRESTDRAREALWMQVEQAAGEPWFLGERASALDLYLAVMTRWRPGLLWFAKRTPRIVQIAKRAAALPAVAPVIERNFS